MLLNLSDTIQNHTQKRYSSLAMVFFIVVGAILISGCSYSTTKPTVLPSEKQPLQSENKPSQADIESLLKAEFTLQREGPEKAFELFYALTSQYTDLFAIERLTYLALIAQNDLYIEKSTNLWLSIDPTSDTAYGLKMQSLVNHLRQKEVFLLLSNAIDNNAQLTFLPLYLEDNIRHTDRINLIESVINNLSAEQKSHPQVQLSRAHLRLMYGEYQSAIEITEQLLLEDKIENKDSVYLIQALSKKHLGRVEDAILTLLESSNETMNNARIMDSLLSLMIENNQPDQALEIFFNAELSTLDTLQMGVNLMQTLLEYQHGQLTLEIAENLPENRIGFHDQIFYLSASALAQLGYKDQAILAMKQVSGYLRSNATNQIALWLYDEGQEKDINAMVLNRIQDESMLEQVDMISQIHEENGNTELSYDLIKQSLITAPESDFLRYRKALLADTLGHWTVTEEELTKLLQKDPTNPHYLNALGYTLLIRTERLDEAMTLIESAYEKAGTDPAIIDSLGWGLFLKGELQKSTYYLEKAWNMLPDPEIAAHFGESLWAQNQFSEAIAVWQTALEASPYSPVLIETIERLSPSLLEAFTQDNT